jgi:hypothetical protein
MMDEMENMAYVTQLNDERDMLTMYAVVCPEHGGLICRTAKEAVDGAAQANSQGHTCVYFAIALTMDPRRLPEFPRLGDADL